MVQPSTEWREQVADDESERFARYGQIIAQVQRRKSQRWGNGRALHRKQLLGLRGEFEVFDGLPAHVKHGLFATPSKHKTLVRLSNGGMDRVADRKPDIRGFAIKVQGLSGPNALGTGIADHQDFLLINHPAFAFARSDEFIGLMESISHSPAALLKYLVKRYGVLGALRLTLRFAGTMGKSFSGFATEPFYSAVPFACGPYAARMRMLPASDQITADAGKNWAADIAARLAKAPLQFDVQLQFFVSESTTPIEDASVDWPEAEAPYLTVARLTLSVQDASPQGDTRLASANEAAMFDPWSGLVAHRPLGEVMRARKVAYFESARVRGAV
jgi:hypothetical protein